MKYNRISILALLLFCAFIGNSYGQDKKPAPSQTATFSQKVGFTDVTIVYSRPSAKGRTIMGDLVPYGKIWRTGANMATKITFSDDVKIAGKSLAAGSYSIFTIPGESEWTVIFNKNWEQGGTADYKEAEDALRVKVQSSKMPVNVETFLINIDNVKPTSAVIGLIWESTMVPIPLEVTL